MLRTIYRYFFPKPMTEHERRMMTLLYLTVQRVK